MSAVPPAGFGAASVGVRDIMAMRSQILQRSQALQQLDRPVGAPTAAPGTSGTAGISFADTLRASLAQVNESQAHAARLSESYERGEVTDIASVMLARQESGLAFEATLQVRNKLLSAYGEIMRMGV